MSNANRANVFLERARQLSSSSPLKNNYSSKSPGTSFEERPSNSSIKQDRRLVHTPSQSTEPDIINTLETMIDDFLMSRYSTHKKIENHKQNEFRVITELKKTLDAEIEKSKTNDMKVLEKVYKDKADKVLMIVKQEALSMDKKLSAFREENNRLKQALSEKNIQAVDAKISGGTMSLYKILETLGREGTDFEINERCSRDIASMMSFKDNGQDYTGLISQIINDSARDLIPIISRKIIEISKNRSELRGSNQRLLSNRQLHAKELLEKIRVKEQVLGKSMHLENMNFEEHKFNSDHCEDAHFGTGEEEVVNREYRTISVSSIGNPNDELVNIPNRGFRAISVSSIGKANDIEISEVDKHTSPPDEVKNAADVLSMIYEELLDELE